MPGNADNYRTILGTVLTFLAMMIVMSYASYKLVQWSDNKDYKLMSEIHEQYFDATDEFSKEDGFWIAAGVLDYSQTKFDGFIDPEIGEIKFYLKSFGNSDDDGGITFTEVNTRTCTKKDFNDVEGTNKESKFYKLGSNS